MMPRAKVEPMASPALLKRLARQHGTPLFVVDQAILRKNLATFRQQLPRVQPYFAVKANSLPEIVRTFYRAGASFDVASIAEFRTVVDNIKDWPPKKQQDFIWDKIIYANPIKDKRTLEELNPYKPLVTYDNLAEVHKIRQYAPDAGLILRLSVPNTGSVVELASKFGAPPGEAVNLIEAAAAAGLTVEGLSFHVGSQCTNFQTTSKPLPSPIAMKEHRGHRRCDSRHWRRVPRHDALCGHSGRPDAARGVHAAVPARHGNLRAVASRTACTLVAEVGKADRNGKRCYYINDGVYHTFGHPRP